MKFLKFIITLMLIISFIATFEVGHSHANEKAKLEAPSKSIEEIYKEQGYKPINDSLNDFENLYRKKPVLPKKFPFEVTHAFGVILNNYLKVDFLNENTKETCRIFIEVTNKDIDPNERKKDIVLTDGTKGIIMKDNPTFHGLKFQKNGLQYLITIGKNNLTKEITEEDLREIAESILVDN